MAAAAWAQASHNRYGRYGLRVTGYDGRRCTGTTGGYEDEDDDDDDEGLSCRCAGRVGLRVTMMTISYKAAAKQAANTGKQTSYKLRYGLVGWVRLQVIGGQTTTADKGRHDEARASLAIVDVDELQ